MRTKVGEERNGDNLKHLHWTITRILWRVSHTLMGIHLELVSFKCDPELF